MIASIITTPVTPEVTMREAGVGWDRLVKADRQSLAIDANLPSTLALKDWGQLKLFERDALTNAINRRITARETTASEIKEKPPLVAQPSQEWDRLSTSSRIKLIQAVPLDERTKIGLTTEDANRTWRSLPLEKKATIPKAQVPAIPKAETGGVLKP